MRSNWVYWSAMSVAVAAAVSLPLGGSSLADHHEKAARNAGIYQVDPRHSSVQFEVRHFVSKVPGNFRTFSATIEIDPGNLGATKAEAEIDASSVDTANDKRDGHLRSEDFFYVSEHPTITFKSTKAKATGENTFELTGDLTIRGVTKSVTLDVELLGIGPGMQGATMLGLEAEGTVNRKDFGIVWNRTLDAGGVMLSDDVEMKLKIEGRLMTEEATAES